MGNWNEEEWVDDQKKKIKEYCDSILNKPYRATLTDIFNILTKYKIDYVPNKDADGEPTMVYGFVVMLDVFKITKDINEETQNISWEVGKYNGITCMAKDAEECIGQLRNGFRLESSSTEIEDAFFQLQDLMEEIVDTIN